MKLGTVALIIIAFLVLAYIPDQCGKYVSPVSNTALYEYQVGGFFGSTYYTNNYTIDEEMLVVNGWWSKYHNKSGEGIMRYPLKDVSYIGANPTLTSSAEAQK